MRIEKDALGTMELEDSCYYGIQTERARRNFALSGITIARYPRYIWATALIKRAAALANRDIGSLEGGIAEAIAGAAADIMAGGCRDQFPLDIYQGGGGTSTNMNLNEVIANLAAERLTGSKGYSLVHPNTHVNMGQSTNDVIPSAMKITIRYLLAELAGKVASFEQQLRRKAEEFREVVKLGRTCLQDAVPLTLGQEFGGYASLLARQKVKLLALQEEFLSLPLGATAVGTGIGTRPGYRKRVFFHLRELTGLAFCQEADLFDGLQNADLYGACSGALKMLAAGLSKIATDLRILSSGPRAGFGELVLPALQPGSSIMPGKVNPVIPELVNQVCFRVMGNDLTVALAVERGELDLNVWEPVITAALFESFALLSGVMETFGDKCIAGIEAREDVCRGYAGNSLALSAVAAAEFGYETGTRAAAYAEEHGCTVAEACVALGLMSREEARELLDPARLTRNPDPVV